MTLGLGMIGVGLFGRRGGGVAPLPTFASRYVRNNRPATAATWNAKAAAVRSGTSRALIACIGDSVTFGFGAGAGDATTNARIASYPARMAAKMAAAGLPAINESFFSNMASPAITPAIMAGYDSRLAVGAGWVSDTNNPTAGGQCWRNDSTLNALSFTPTIPVDTFIVWYYTEPTFGDFTLDVDGAGQTAHSQNVAKSFAKLTKTVALGTHTLNIKRTAGNVRFGGVIAYNSAARAVDVINLGYSGSTTAIWADATDPWSPLNALGALAPDLTIIKLGINDFNTSVPLATFKANLNTIITRARLSGDVILCFPNQTNSQTPEYQDSYADAMRDVAEAANVRLVDQYNALGSYAALNAAGKMFDGLHPKAVPYDDEAARLASALTSNAPALPTSSFDPATLFGGALGAFYDPGDLASMWQDTAATVAAAIGQPVARINDKSGNAAHATQAAAGLRPLLGADPFGNRYLQSDGVDDWLRALFTFTGNWTRISVVRQQAWSSGHVFGSGTAATNGVLFQNGTNPELRLYSGTVPTTGNLDAPVGIDSIIVERFSGATTTLKVNNFGYAAINPGTGLPDGVTLFAASNGTAPVRARLYGFLMINRTLTDPEIAQCVAHFGAKGDVVL
jgi:lysophospholipase L1-like esterase